VAEWQTRWLQVPVSFGTWGFKSPLGHSKVFDVSGRLLLTKLGCGGFFGLELEFRAVRSVLWVRSVPMVVSVVGVLVLCRFWVV